MLELNKFISTVPSQGIKVEIRVLESSANLRAHLQPAVEHCRGASSLELKIFNLSGHLTQHTSSGPFKATGARARQACQAPRAIAGRRSPMSQVKISPRLLI